MTRKVLIGYIIFIFVLTSFAVFLPPKVADIYVSLSIFAMGIGAIICQKKFHHGKFVDMGFRLNRNALIGIGIGTVFTAIILALHYWLPLRLGLFELTISESSPAAASGASLILIASILVLGGGAMFFVACLFGEELAFRGYILPKLEEIFGTFKAVILCSVIFGLWHLPAYFSIYRGGAAENGWASVIQMLLGHGISAIPVCILYITTRELYGVSLYHALVNVFGYLIFGNPALGEASKDAIYSVKILNEPVLEAMGWTFHILGILIMLALCALVRRLIVRRDILATPANSR